jgi:hypothetical protein
MVTTYQTLKVFISSPKDVSGERRLLEDLVDRINPATKETLGIELDILSWTQLPPITPVLSEQKIQDILNDEVRKCNIFVLILYKRYGTKQPGWKKSNVEREVDIAINLLKKEKKIMFLSYFRNIPKDLNEGSQVRNVKRLREKLERRNVFYKTYSKPNEFKELITHDLYSTILRYRLATRKNRALQKFWNLGIPDRPTYPTLAIVYPSLDRKHMGPRQDTKVWLNRLVPNLVFEDYKALQKIEKSLRLIDFHDFRIFNSMSVPSDSQFMNRFWICLPRNNPGLLQTARYARISKFKLIRGKEPRSSVLLWRRSLNSKKYVTVRSPLAKYLREQRKDMDIKGQWNQEMENMIAKDYAILARFSDEQKTIVTKEGILKDYFLAGLRGLGTWGAGWFIDRKYDYFLKMPPNRNIQLLLEVEHRNGRIYDVVDVSSKPQSYFDKQNSLDTIRKTIESFRRSKSLAT